MKVISLFACLAIGGIIVETIGARLKRAGGGTKISIEQAPYVVSLRRNSRHVCTGAFISTQHVLTAAYCVFNASLGPFYDTLVVSGTDQINRSDAGTTIQKISLPHGFLEGKFWHDIAVITLSGHVEWNEKENEIALPEAEQPCPEYATFTGFQVRRSQHGNPGLLQMRIRIHPFNPFDDTHDYNQIFYGTTPLSGTLSSADCGGPLVHEGRVVGIASVKSENWSHSSYFVYVSKFEAFIKQSMEITPSSSSGSSFVYSPPAKRRRH